MMMKYLFLDIKRVRNEDGLRGVLVWFLEVASFAQISYRLFRGWRLSRMDIPPLRYLLEKSVECFTHIHLPSKAEIGPGLRIYHGFGLIVNGKCILGENTTLYARVTIGERFPHDGCPILGDHVVCGTGACIYGPIVVAAGSVVRSGAVLTFVR